MVRFCRYHVKGCAGWGVVGGGVPPLAALVSSIASSGASITRPHSESVQLGGLAMLEVADDDLFDLGALVDHKLTSKSPI